MSEHALPARLMGAPRYGIDDLEVADLTCLEDFTQAPSSAVRSRMAPSPSLVPSGSAPTPSIFDRSESLTTIRFGQLATMAIVGLSANLTKQPAGVVTQTSSRFTS